METQKTQKAGKDLSEQIKQVTMESHMRAENTELMLSFQKGQVTMQQYKLLLSSLHEIYQTLEEELDKNSGHPAVEPIYFPSELARLEPIEKDLEFFYGPDWKQKIVVPAATTRYCDRLRKIGKENPEYLVAHAYTRYLGDLSGGQVLGRIAQKSMGLKNGEGLSFFAFPGVSSPNLFKQLYRSRMNVLELSEEQRKGVLDEAVKSFELNIQVFEDVQKVLNVTEKQMDSKNVKCKNTLQSSMMSNSFYRMLLGIFVAVVTMGICMS
ncbi:heme oxygenase-like [Corythoichthys intestinalis]|uniref:heme oxygenase-like n=1 Tax=Corythoichthys intestinalis TaxID=161448 RepID=UPI0025A5476D|nr:heme oxygenase-like [Corythoichthys intestinalis]XP_061791706.1 heme oxygenase-like [Nerophis lumbriciformis]